MNGLHIEPEQMLSKESVLAAKQKPSEIFSGDEQQVFLAERAEKENQEYACLQKKLTQVVAKEILQEAMNSGYLKYWDAIHHLEETHRQIRHIQLPIEVFSHKQSQVIFPLAEQNGAVFISVQGILLDCAIEYSKCIASVIKMKKADITTELVLSRIERTK